MTPSELGRSRPLRIGRASAWRTPPTITGIRAKSSSGKTPTAGVVSIRGDRLLALSCTSSRQVRNFPPPPSCSASGLVHPVSRTACLPAFPSPLTTISSHLQPGAPSSLSPSPSMVGTFCALSSNNHRWNPQHPQGFAWALEAPQAQMGGSAGPALQPVVHAGSCGSLVWECPSGCVLRDHIWFQGLGALSLPLRRLQPTSATGEPEQWAQLGVLAPRICCQTADQHSPETPVTATLEISPQTQTQTLSTLFPFPLPVFLSRVSGVSGKFSLGAGAPRFLSPEKIGDVAYSRVGPHLVSASGRRCGLVCTKVWACVQGHLCGFSLASHRTESEFSQSSPRTLVSALPSIVTAAHPTNEQKQADSQRPIWQTHRTKAGGHKAVVAEAGLEPRSAGSRPGLVLCSRNVLLLLQRGTMGFGKSSPFLALSILVLCQAGGLQATPLR